MKENIIISTYSAMLTNLKNGWTSLEDMFACIFQLRNLIKETKLWEKKKVNRKCYSN